MEIQEMPRKTTDKLDLVMKLLSKVSEEKIREMLAQVEGPKDWKKTERTCAKCGLEGFVDPDFGIRTVRGKEFAQGWCRTCRNTTQYTKPSKR